MNNIKIYGVFVFWVIIVMTILAFLLNLNLFASNIKSNQLGYEKIVFKKEKTDTLKAKALQVLQTKCNVCHRRKNPFLIFKEKNMERRSSRINKQVFELKRMPKKEGEPLTDKEYETLKFWIESL